jgi:hypothetical protein
MRAKRPGPVGPRQDSARTMYIRLIKEGLSDEKIWSRVHRKFPKLKNSVKWHRWFATTKEGCRG